MIGILLTPPQGEAHLRGYFGTTVKRARREEGVPDGETALGR